MHFLGGLALNVTIGRTIKPFRDNTGLFWRVLRGKWHSQTPPSDLQPRGGAAASLLLSTYLRPDLSYMAPQPLGAEVLSVALGRDGLREIRQQACG